jgi:hypothetical protein
MNSLVRVSFNWKSFNRLWEICLLIKIKVLVLVKYKKQK